MKAKLFFLVIILMVLCYSGIAYAGEEITLTTYYPAPYGEYNSLSVGDPTAGYTATNPGELLVQGNVGIGTTSPGARLEVVDRSVILRDTSTGLWRGPWFRFITDEAAAGQKEIYMAWQKTAAGSDTGVGRFYIRKKDASNLNLDWLVYYGDTNNVIINQWKDSAEPWGDFIVQNGNVGIGTTAPGTYDGEQAQLDVADYAAADDIYLKNPKSGNPGWASAMGGGFISGYGSSMNLSGSGTYTVLCWATYFSCEDYATALRLDGTAVESHSGYGGDSAGCDQNTIMIRLTGVSAGSHTWSLSRGSQHRYMWMASLE